MYSYTAFHFTWANLFYIYFYYFYILLFNIFIFYIYFTWAVHISHSMRNLLNILQDSSKLTKSLNSLQWSFHLPHQLKNLFSEQSPQDLGKNRAEFFKRISFPSLATVKGWILGMGRRSSVGLDPSCVISQFPCQEPIAHCPSPGNFSRKVRRLDSWWMMCFINFAKVYHLRVAPVCSLASELNIKAGDWCLIHSTERRFLTLTTRDVPSKNFKPWEIMLHYPRMRCVAFCVSFPHASVWVAGENCRWKLHWPGFHT